MTPRLHAKLGYKERLSKTQFCCAEPFRSEEDIQYSKVRFV